MHVRVSLLLIALYSTKIMNLLAFNKIFIENQVIQSKTSKNNKIFNKK